LLHSQAALAACEIMKAALALGLLLYAALADAAPYLGSNPFNLPTTIKAGMFDTVSHGTFVKLDNAIFYMLPGPCDVSTGWLFSV
jgi:hypothetical protein